MHTNVVLGFLIVGLAVVGADEKSADTPVKGGLSLLSTLAEWQYPDSKLKGASVTDGGNPQQQSVKCKAVLTTSDPVDKVAEFYSKKLAATDAKTVSMQDDSQGRPVAIRVIVVNKAKTSTTLVISRADGEEETHIAWSHYIRF